MFNFNVMYSMSEKENADVYCVPLYAQRFHFKKLLVKHLGQSRKRFDCHPPAPDVVLCPPKAQIVSEELVYFYYLAVTSMKGINSHTNGHFYRFSFSFVAFVAFS